MLNSILLCKSLTFHNQPKQQFFSTFLSTQKSTLVISAPTSQFPLTDDNCFNCESLILYAEYVDLLRQSGPTTEHSGKCCLMNLILKMPMQQFQMRLNPTPRRKKSCFSRQVTYPTVRLQTSTQVLSAALFLLSLVPSTAMKPSLPRTPFHLLQHVVESVMVMAPNPLATCLTRRTSAGMTTE